LYRGHYLEQASYSKGELVLGNLHGPDRLAGLVAVVTGSASSIGRATAGLPAAWGASVTGMISESPSAEGYQTARPFNWNFTAADLAGLLQRISARQEPPACQTLPDSPDELTGLPT
jgi:NAD(P)-dependent dehydrogenase (short-subunit alcohol dehydrogenase family)